MGSALSIKAGRLYWLTAATLEHRPHLRPGDRKQYFVAELYAAAERWRVELVAWTLMEHHYHAILVPEVGSDLPRFVARLHGQTTRFINQQEETPGRQVWWQYWDRFLYTEGDVWSRVNYIWWNPVRHGFCNQPEEWPWTNLQTLMTDADEVTRAGLQRFPAPRRLPDEL